MNKNFDKILLLVSVIACAAGVGFWHANKDKKTEVNTAHVGRALTGKIYAAAALPVPENKTQEWTAPAPIADNELWAYDLFSPVEVKWNGTAKKYEPKGEINAIVPFGLKLIAINHPTYRLTLRGTVARKDDNGRAYTEVLLYDSEAIVENASGSTTKGKLIRARQKDDLPEDGITVSEVVTRETINADGTKTKDTFVKVFDKRLNREFALTEKPHEFKDTANIVFAAANDTAKTWTLQNIGDQINDGEIGIFTLKGVDFVARTVSVEKIYRPNPRKPEVAVTETLSVTAP